MVHFRLTDEGTIELEGFGKDFEHHLRGHIYPMLSEVEIAVHCGAPADEFRIKAAVEVEKMSTNQVLQKVIGGTSQVKEMLLPLVELGDVWWTNVSGILMNLPEQATDGAFPVSRLGLKILHFDFEHNLMSWDK